MNRLTFQRRLLKLYVELFLAGLKHLPWLRSADLAATLSNQTQKLLNLPGNLPFFATPVTPLEEVQHLIRRLHPIDCGKPLVRFGPNGDGGYLIPDDLAGVQACFSPGVSTIAGFEADCARRGMDVFMIDASVDQPPVEHPRFHFRRQFLGAIAEGNFITLEDWINEEVEPDSGDLLLQMDIERFEYETLLSTPLSVLNRFRIIVVEFHCLDYLFSEPVYSIYRRVFERLLCTHECVHIHPNNICPPLNVRGFESLHLAEFTFLRKDRITTGAEFCASFPHRLDHDNTSRAPVRLPRTYYRDQQVRANGQPPPQPQAVFRK